MAISLLSAKTISRIAAGEIIERPANVVKELVENSIDANSRTIIIKIESAGCNLISVTDDGDGISKEDIELAFVRHATSKLQDDKLIEIHHLGFRGEALSSIAAISRVKLSSKVNSSTAWSISYEGGEKIDIPISCAMLKGTEIEVRDLFFATPNRLKFLKSIKYENQYIINIINTLAMINPFIAFSLSTNSKEVFKYRKQSSLYLRLIEIDNRFENSFKIYANIENIEITGYACKPTINYINSSMIYIFVNKRPIKDSMLIGAIRYAYHDFIPHNRYPVLMLNLTIPYDQIDVNVHPHKYEVRFQNKKLIYNIVVRSVIKSLESSRLFAIKSQITKDLSDPFTKDLSNHFNKVLEEETKPSNILNEDKKSKYIGEKILDNTFHYQLNKTSVDYNNHPSLANLHCNLQHNLINKNKAAHKELAEDYPLGVAKCQVYNTYIISESKDALVIVDQHAAHERLLYESLKQKTSLKTQLLLIPEIICFSNQSLVEVLKEYQEKLSIIGVNIEIKSESEILVTKIPAILGVVNIKDMIVEIAERLLEIGDTLPVEDNINKILSKIACYFSIRAGREMRIEEMNELLRQMEKTPFSEQCNHGRPTYVRIELKTIKKLVERQ